MSTDPWETKQRKDEVIVFFPTIARQLEGGSKVAVSIHGWLYHPKRDTKLRRVPRTSSSRDFLDMSHSHGRRRALVGRCRGLTAVRVQAILAGLKRTMPPAANALELFLVERRLSAFIVDNRRGKRVSIQFLSSEEGSGSCAPYSVEGA